MSIKRIISTQVLNQPGRVIAAQRTMSTYILNQYTAKDKVIEDMKVEMLYQFSELIAHMKEHIKIEENNTKTILTGEFVIMSLAEYDDLISKLDKEY